MGTRADFYEGRGGHAQWLGSLGWKGHPCGERLRPVMASRTLHDYRNAVARLDVCEDFHSPALGGWPWGWETSHDTDFAYAFELDRDVQIASDGAADGILWVSNFGGPWITAMNTIFTLETGLSLYERSEPKLGPDALPRMKSRPVPVERLGDALKLVRGGK